MPTDHNHTESSDSDPAAAMDVPRSANPTDSSSANAVASQPDGEASMRDGKDVPPETMILVPGAAAPPMRHPDGVWALWATEVDITADTDSDHSDEVARFAGQWMPEQPPADDLYDGTLVIRLTHPAGALPGDQVADVEMLLAHHGRWQRVGQWHRLDHDWPRLVAPTAAAVMRLHCELVEAGA